MNDVNRSYNKLSCIYNVILCIVLSSLYVGSLYIWGKSEGRNHPSTVKKRCLSVAIMSLVSAICVYFFADREYFGQDVSFFSLLGLRLPGLFPAMILPLCLTMVLFLGPIALLYNEGMCYNYFDRKWWFCNVRNILFLRNLAFAPFFEEFTFRACMLPILVPCFEDLTCVILCPFFFGIAHFHHLIQRLADGVHFKNAVLESLFQFAYTTVFGAYSTFLFLRTGHLSAPFIVHAFCNFMGFPDFAQVLEQPQPKKIILVICFVVGLVLWIFFLNPITNPVIYNNEIYVSSTNPS